MGGNGFWCIFLLLENAESAEASRVPTTLSAAPGKPTSTAEMLAPRAHSYPAPCLLAAYLVDHPTAKHLPQTPVIHRLLPELIVLCQ